MAHKDEKHNITGLPGDGFPYCEI